MPDGQVAPDGPVPQAAGRSLDEHVMPAAGRPADGEPAPPGEPADPERAHPSWLGEATGRFDLDLPDPGLTNPSWLGEPTGRPDADEPFDQYALPPAGLEEPADSGEALSARTEEIAPQAGHAGAMYGPQQVGAVRTRAGAVRTQARMAPPGGDPVGEPAAAPGPPAGFGPAAGAPTEAFTMPVQEVPREGWFDPRLHGDRRVRPEARPARRRVRPPRPPRRAAVAMPLLILFALVATFFSWVSVEPLWLAAGHGRIGTLTVTSCAGSGLMQRCLGEFVTPGRDFSAVSVNVLGPPGQAEGLSAPARMVGGNSHRAYVTNGTGGLHLRWIVGLSLVLLCSVGIVFATGALRLPERRERLAAVGLSFAGPLLITIGFLAATF